MTQGYSTDIPSSLYLDLKIFVMRVKSLWISIGSPFGSSLWGSRTYFSSPSIHALIPGKIQLTTSTNCNGHRYRCSPNIPPSLNGSHIPYSWMIIKFILNILSTNNSEIITGKNREFFISQSELNARACTCCCKL